MSSQPFNLNELQCILDKIGLDIHVAGKEKSYAKPTFKPKYLAEQGTHQKALNAIIEIREIWTYVIREAYYNYSNIYSKLTIPISDELKQTFRKHKEDFAVYDKILKKWLTKPEEPKYKYCYNGEDFVEFIDAKNEITGNRLLLVGKYTVLKQEPNLLSETDTAPRLFDGFVMPETTLTVGVPGCGKTTYIIKKHRPGSLVLTSCAEGAQDIRSRMAEIEGGQAPDYKDSYRTIDSYLLNSRDRCSRVWVDEALMEHPGKLFLVCLFSRCSALFLLGDPNQLQFINRLGVKFLYDKSSMFFEPTKTLNKSYRCPVDVMVMINALGKYDGGAVSASSVLRSMKTKTFTVLKDLPKSDDEDVKYLVFKQAEKRLMKKKGYNVSTVHEFQGKEAAHVVLVRMSHNLEEPLYRSIPHMLVGMSRHKETLTYYTPVTDSLKKLLDFSITTAELKRHQKVIRS